MFDNIGHRRSGIQVMTNIWCVYSAQACILPHLSRYYDLDLGLNNTQIGFLMVLPYLAMVLFQPLWGVLADRLLGRTKTYRMGLICSCLTLFIYSISYQTMGFYGLLGGAILFMIFYGTNSPLSTSIILSYLGQKRRHLFGRIRVFGSTSFTVTVFILCPLAVTLSHWMGFYGRTMIFWMGCIFFILTCIFTRWDESHFEKHHRPEFKSFKNLFFNRNLILFFFIIFITGMTFTSELLLIGPYVGHLGLPEIFYSSLWLTGVGFEIILTFFMAPIVLKVGLKRTIVIGIAAEGIRWVGIALLTSPIYILLFSLMHGPAVLGIFFVTATYLDAECDESIRSTAQAMLYFSLMSGQISGLALGSLLLKWFSYLPKVEAIRIGFFYFGINAILAAILFSLFVAKESVPPSKVVEKV